MKFRHFASLLCGFAVPITVFAVSADNTIRIADQPVPRDLNARQVVTNPLLTPDYTDRDVFSLMIFDEPLVPTQRTADSTEEKAAFVGMINSAIGLVENNQNCAELIEAFLTKYPRSRWRAALEYNLGLIKYSKGLFTPCIGHFQSGYELAKDSQDDQAKRLSDMSLSYWTEMMAKLGRVDETESLVKLARERKPEGSVRARVEILEGALQVLKDSKPGTAFKCGPFALASARSTLGLLPVHTDAIANSTSGPEGFSMSRVAQLARDSGMSPKIVRASAAELSVLPLPAVVHWKLGHYGALTERSIDGTRYHLVDPTFKFDGWVPSSSIEAEASGLYIVFSGAPTFAEVDAQTAGAAFGRGNPNAKLPNQQKPGDEQVPKKDCNKEAMAHWTVHTMSVSLHVEDTPVQYAHHVGPPAHVTVFNNESASLLPANDNATTFGSQWSHNWNSYVVSLNVPVAGSVTVAVRGGGAETHSLTVTGADGEASSPANLRGMSRLFYTGTVSDTFRRELPNGWVERFNRARNTATGKVYYLTSVEDEVGNAVTVDYVLGENRINRLVDELGNIVKFNYGSGTNANRVSDIDDPFNRTSIFTYSSTGAQASGSRLDSIEDPIGIVSVFTYTTGGKIATLVTPSGTTVFTRGTGPDSLDRWIEIKSPTASGATAETERVEYKNSIVNSATTVYTPTVAGEIVPRTSIPVQNSPNVGFGVPDTTHRFSTQMSFYWDRKQWKAVMDWRGTNNWIDYDKATAYRWLRTTPTGFELSPTLSAIKSPLESRVWFNYPGQDANGGDKYNAEGTINIPSKAARVVASNTTTQLSQMTCNILGNPTLTVDPLGRRVRYTYENNDMDLNKMEVAVSGTSTGTYTYETVFQANYPALGTPHRPNWIRTASGTSGQIDLDWNNRGQLTSLTNARGEVTTYDYAAGKLTEINPGLSGASDKITLTYDSAQRVNSRTAWTYTGSYAYDNLDRLTTASYPDGTTETWNYQISGTGGQTQDLWRYKDRLGRFTNYIYNGLRQVTSVTDPLNRTTLLEWCRCGALQKLTDPKNQVTDWVYDIEGRLTEKKIAGSTVQKNVYDPYRGLLASGTDALGQAKVYTYALDNRLTNLQYQNEVNSTPDVTYTWDARYPRMTSLVDGVPGTTTYAYGAIGGNSANLLETENLAGADKIIRYTYDKVARLFSRDIDSANFIEYYRDEIGRVRGTIATSGSIGYFYSPTDGRLTSVVNPSNGQTLNIGYVNNDPVKPPNLLELLTTSGSATKAQLDYAAINAMGRIGKITSSVSSVWSSTYTYDNADQVTRANTTGTVAPADNRYTYDVAANVEEWWQIISGSSTYYPYTKDNTNFTTKILKGTTSGTGSPYLTFTKDANGNVTGWTDAISGKSETLEWDAENRLVSVTQSPANKEFVMTYDGRNRLTIIEEKLSGVTQKSTRLVWSGMEICEERDNATNTVITKYYPDGELQWTAGTWVPIWYYRDNLGSILETYSVAGTRVSQRRFDEWGRMTGSAAGPGVSKKGYTGHYQPEGMDYVMAPYRWYSPTTRAWLSRDPIGEAGGINLYGYVANNPVNLWDPFGLEENLILYNPNVPKQAGKIPAAKAIPSDPNRFTTAGEGSPSGPLDETGKPLSPEEFVDRAKQAGWDGKKPLLMKQCMAGHSFNGDTPFAQKVHDLTGAEVTAPDGYHYYKWAPKTEFYGVRIYGGGVTSNLHEGGQWATFK